MGWITFQDGCKVMDVTRETVSRWKGQLRRDGLGGILKNGKVGKRFRLIPGKQTQLTALLKKSPKKYGHDCKRWAGRLVKEFALRNWDLSISLRTANLWMKMSHPSSPHELPEINRSLKN